MEHVSHADDGGVVSKLRRPWMATFMIQSGWISELERGIRDEAITNGS